MKKRGMSQIIITAMLVFALVAVAGAIFFPKIASLAASIFGAVGIEGEKCSDTGKTANDYDSTMIQLLEKNKENEATSLCAEFKKCFPGKELSPSVKVYFENKITRLSLQTTKEYFSKPTQSYETMKTYENYKKCYTEELSPELTYAIANSYFKELKCYDSWGNKEKDKLFVSIDGDKQRVEAARLYKLTLASGKKEFSVDKKNEINVRFANLYGVEHAEANMPNTPSTYLKEVLSAAKTKKFNELSMDEQMALELFRKTILPMDLAWEYEDKIGFKPEEQSTLHECDFNYYNGVWGSRGTANPLATEEEKYFWRIKAFLDDCCKTTSQYACEYTDELIKAYNKKYNPLFADYNKDVEEFKLQLPICRAKVEFFLRNYEKAITELKKVFADVCTKNGGTCTNKIACQEQITDITCGSVVDVCCVTDTSKYNRFALTEMPSIRKAKTLYDELRKKLDERGLGYIGKSEGEISIERFEKRSDCEKLGRICNETCPSGYEETSELGNCAELTKKCCRKRVEVKFELVDCPKDIAECLPKESCPEARQVTGTKCEATNTICCKKQGQENRCAYRSETLPNEGACDCDGDGKLNEPEDCDGAQRNLCIDTDSTANSNFKCFTTQDLQVVKCAISTSTNDLKNTEQCDCNMDNSIDIDFTDYSTNRYLDDCGGNHPVYGKINYCLSNKKCYKEPLCVGGVTSNCRCYSSSENFVQCTFPKTCSNGVCT